MVRTRIIVISMSNALERRKRFSQRAKDAPVPWQFVDGHSTLHPALRYDEDTAIVVRGRPLRKGELGCYSSHYAAWENLIADEYDQYIVLEDDVIIDWKFLGEVSNLSIAEFGYQYLRLFFKRPARENIIRNEFIERSKKIVDLFGTGLGTQGYIITKSAARIFLRHCERVRRPIDDAMDRSWEHGVANLSIFPFPIIEEYGESGIGNARFEKFTIPARLKLRRVSRRVTEFLVRRFLSAKRDVNYRIKRLRQR